MRMMTANRRVGLWAMAAAGLIGGMAQAAARPGAAPTPIPKPKTAKTALPRMVASGTPLEAALAKLDLTVEQRATVSQALAVWKEGQTKAAVDLATKRKTLAAQLLKETDPVKRAALLKQVGELKELTDVEKYNSAKAAVKAKKAVPAELLATVDGLVHAAQTDRAAKRFQDFLAELSAREIKLTADQKSKADAEKGRLASTLKDLPPGADKDATAAADAAIKAVSALLTPEQLDKLNAPRPELPPSP